MNFKNTLGKVSSLAQNNKCYRYLSFSFCLCLVVLISADKVKAEHLTVLTESLYPMSYTISGEGDKYIRGYAVELVRAVLAESGDDYEIRIVPWVRAVRTLDRQKNVIVFSMARTPEREDKYHWIGEITPVNISLYGLRKDEHKLPRTLKKAKDFRIGVHRGDIGQEFFKNKAFNNIIVVKDIERNLFLLHRNRLDLIPFADVYIEQMALRAGYKGSDLISLIPLPELKTVVSIALSKSSDPEVKENLQRAYRVVKDSGRFDEIMGPFFKLTNKE